MGSNHKKTVSLKEVAQIVGGRIDGSDATQIARLAPSNQPASDALTYMAGKFVAPSTASQFAAVIVDQNGAQKIRTVDASTPLVIVETPQQASIKLIDVFFPRLHAKEMFVSHGTAVISPDAQIGEDCVIHPNVAIYPNVKIGARTIIYAGVVIREDTVIGNDCIIHPNAVIGADGFGYIPDAVEGLKAVPQVGNVIIEDKVHIGANTTIDRATLGVTRIGMGTKIDNQVQIGHNTQIGKFCIICGKVAIAGSCEIGDRVVLAGKVGVADHIRIISGVRVAGGGDVLFDILEPGDYAGVPAIKAATHRRNNVEVMRLAKTMATLKKTTD